MPHHQTATHKIPIDGRYSFALPLLCASLALLLPRRAQAQERVALDAESLVARLVAQSPVVQIAEARTERARALHVGAGAFSRENPTLSLWGGPRQIGTGEWLADVVVTLSMPFDLSGVRGARSRAAEGAVQLAEAEAVEARQDARAEALGLWVQCLGAQAWVAVQSLRVQAEETSVRVAETRQRNGAAGMVDVTLATVALAVARGALLAAEASRDASLVALRSRLALPPDAPLQVGGTLVDDAPMPALDELLRRLPRRADLRRTTFAAAASSREADLQERLGVPPLRLGLSGGRENEYYGRVGLDFALPVFQRNQTAVAVARAGVRVAEIEREALRARAEAELLAAYTAWSGARRAWQTLEDALPAAARAEQLGLRAYELGQRDLESTVVVLRQTHELRAAHHDAAVAVAEARRAIDRAVGGL